MWASGLLTPDISNEPTVFIFMCQGTALPESFTLLLSAMTQNTKIFNIFNVSNKTGDARIKVTLRRVRVTTVAVERKLNVKFTLEQATKAQRKSRCIALILFQLGTRWGGWLTPRPGRFTPWERDRYPLYRWLGGPQGRSGWVRKISPPPGFDSRTVQPRSQ